MCRKGVLQLSASGGKPNSDSACKELGAKNITRVTDAGESLHRLTDVRSGVPGKDRLRCWYALELSGDAFV